MYSNVRNKYRPIGHGCGSNICVWICVSWSLLTFLGILLLELRQTFQFFYSYSGKFVRTLYLLLTLSIVTPTINLSSVRSDLLVEYIFVCHSHHLSFWQYTDLVSYNSILHQLVRFFTRICVPVIYSFSKIYLHCLVYI